MGIGCGGRMFFGVGVGLLVIYVLRSFIYFWERIKRYCYINICRKIYVVGILRVYLKNKWLMLNFYFIIIDVF